MKYQINKAGLENVRKTAKTTPMQTAMLAYCSKCSAEIFGHWKHEYTRAMGDEIGAEMLKFREMTQCPVCKAELLKQNGFFARVRQEGMNPLIDIDAEFETMRKIRNVQEEAKATQLVETLCAKLDVAEETRYDDQKCQQVHGTTGALKTYLEQVIRAEANIIMQRKHLMLLYVQKEENEREQIYYQKYLPARHDEQIAEAKNACKQYAKELKAAQTKPAPKFKTKMPQKPKEPEYKKPNLFNRKKVLEENQQLEEAYNAQLEKYKQKFAAYKQEKAQFTDEVQRAQEEEILAVQLKLQQAEEKAEVLKAQKAGITKAAKSAPSPAKAAKELLKKEISEAETMLQKLLACRRALYDTNVVFTKYRNLIAVSTFYEYLCAGRCDALEGAHGAYNLYESECRANLIISQLNQVIESLEQIKNSQFAIYKELQSINATLDSLSSSMYEAVRSIRTIECNTTDMKAYLNTVAENSSVIAHNTAVAAHYAKVNADLTNSLGYLIALQ